MAGEWTAKEAEVSHKAPSQSGREESRNNRARHAQKFRRICQIYLHIPQRIPINGGFELIEGPNSRVYTNNIKSGTKRALNIVYHQNYQYSHLTSGEKK